MTHTKSPLGREPSKPMFVNWRGERLEVVGLYEDAVRVARCGLTRVIPNSEVDLVVTSDTPKCFKPRTHA